MANPEAEKRKKLGRILAIAFVAVLAMGAGPGLLLINPDPESADATFTFLGLPKVYAWGLLCDAAEVAIVVTAYFKVWRDDDDQEVKS